MVDDFLLGVNYWPPRKAMYWWKDFDAGEVDEEFAQIAAYGMHLVRFFLLWEDFQPDPDRIDGRRLADLSTVMDLAAKHHLRATPTLLVGNMSGIMWFPIWAFTDRPENGATPQIAAGHYIHRQLRSPFSDPFMLRAEIRLAEAVAGAIGSHPALHSWDLANEIDQAYLPENADTGWLWSWCLARALRAGHPDTMVTYGAHSLSLTTDRLTIPALAPSLDYLAMHGYPIYSDVARGPLDIEFVPFITRLTAALGGTPTLMQEFGLPTAGPGQPSHTIKDDFLGEEKGQFLASEEDAAAYYAAVLHRLRETGALGALAWVYADYDRALWDRPPLDRAIRERTFGLFRADRSPKEAATVIKQFSTELAVDAAGPRVDEPRARFLPPAIDPVAYYRDPEASFRAAYAQYLAALDNA